MPLPLEILSNIKDAIDKAEVDIKSIEDVISDLRASGVDASIQEQSLKAAKDQLSQLRIFYSRQSKR